MAQGKAMKIIMLVVIVCVLLAVLLVWKKPHWLPGGVAPTQKFPQAVSIDISDQPTMGDKDAPIQVVSFEDFKCVNCRFFDLQLLPWIVKEYVKTGQANYTAISVSFLPNSMQAAVASRCVYKQDPQQFFVFADLLFHKQGDEMTNWANTAKLLQWSSQLKGISHDQFSACLMNPKMVTEIIDNTQQGVDIMGGSLSTPAVYINGILVRPLTQQHIKETIQYVRKQKEGV